MKWKNLKLGMKFFVTFGIVVVLLIGVAIWSIMGIGDIIKNANEVVDGNKLRTELTQRHVDHLKWASKVSLYVTDSKHEELKVQTDYHQCAFGKWYYGEERKHAEEVAPQLEQYFAEIEEPHKQLHESAIEIEQILKTNSGDTATKQAVSYFQNVTTGYLNTVGGLLEKIIASSKDYIMTDEVMISKANTTNWGVGIFGSLAAIIAVLFALIISRGIINPLKKSAGFAE